MVRDSLSRYSLMGFTLFELVVVMALSGIVLSGLVNAARREMDRMAVVAARESVAGLLHRARQEAIAYGGSQVLVQSDPPMGQLIAGSDILATTSPGDEFGVTLGLSRDRSEALLMFGPLGLGLVSSQTLTFRKGDQESVLVISALGRVDRR